MNSVVKFIIGIIIFLVGIYWYAAGSFGLPGFGPLGVEALSALKTVLVGVIGLVLIFLGLIIAWIEYEDIKWSKKK
jgi:hypothetical protein